MKKSVFVYFLIATVYLFHLLVPDVVFGQAGEVFNKYKDTFRRQDVHEHFPKVLRAFKTPANQARAYPLFIEDLVSDPKGIRTYYKNTDDSILVLLTINSDFQALFEDDQFHLLLRSTTQIEALAKLIEDIPDDELTSDGQVCEVPPPPATLSIGSGNNPRQSGEIGKPLAEPFVVSVLSQDEKPLQGIAVTFGTEGGGQLWGESSQTINTNEDGEAGITFTLGSNPGTYLVKASVAAKDSLNGIELTQTFTATAIVPPRKTISIVSGDDQAGKVGQPLAEPFVVRVLDQDKKPLQGIEVTFTVTAGNGRLSATTQKTDVYGQARTTLTLGARAGTYLVRASVSGTAQQTFTATAIDQEDHVPPPPPMYWIEGNTIYHRPTGGEKEIFLQPKDGTLTGGLAVDTIGGRVYWTEQTHNNMGRIRSANLDGTGVRLVKEILAVPFNITVGTDKIGKRWVYWTTSRNKIQRIKVDGSDFQGNFMAFPQSPTPPNHIAFDQGEHRLYWTERGRIRGVASNGTGKRETIVEALGELGGIAVANGVVYWTEQTNGLGSVRSMNRNGSGGKKLLVSLEEIIPGGIAVDAVGRKVYWMTSHGIRSAPLTGETVVIREEEPAGIALGGTVAAGAPAAPSISPVVSVENTLLANYPNPFNPETWIPYQLSASADVSISIYSLNGHLVRRLYLGYQSAGVYRSRSRAAYWDGRNELGERVASGLYFYTLTAGDFTATRKMLIRK